MQLLPLNFAAPFMLGDPVPSAAALQSCFMLSLAVELKREEKEKKKRQNVSNKQKPSKTKRKKKELMF